MNMPRFLPKVGLNHARVFVLALVIALSSFAGGYAFGITGFIAETKNFPRVSISREIPAEKNLDFSLFWSVWDTLQTSYVDKSKINEADMVYGAIKGMVSALGDPYTVFLSPKENKMSQEDLSGSFGGVGIQIEAKGKQIAVAAPLPNTPAEKAGVKAGDFIVGIKDDKKGIETSTVGLSVYEAVQAIRGPEGTSVTLLLTRDGSETPITVDLTRAKIDVPSVTYEELGENKEYSHVKLMKFGLQTSAEWDAAIEKTLSNPNLKGVIVDLRNNPGGYLEKAVDLASEFVDKGTLILFREDARGTKMEERTAKAGRLTGKKIVVLINKGSASSSEILAGALRDQKSIKLIGETSFGKGTVQEPQSLVNGAGLHITIEKWLTPTGYWVNDKGLEPDIKVEDNPDTSEDEQLQEAIKALNS